MTGFCTVGRERLSRNFYRCVVGVAITWIGLVGIDGHESLAQEVVRVDENAVELDNSLRDAATSQSATRKVRGPRKPISGRVVRLTGAFKTNEVYADGYAPFNGRAAGDDGILVYQNTLGSISFRPGRGQWVADDVYTLIRSYCLLNKFRVRVSGGVEGGGGVFNADVSLYDGCPGEGGHEIPGTLFRFSDLNDDASIMHDLVGDFSDRGVCDDGQECRVSLQDCGDASICESNPPFIPWNIWLRIRFDTDEAGVIAGAPAQVGFSEDSFGLSLAPCFTWFGGWPEHPHASLWIEIFADSGCVLCNSDSHCDDGLFCNGLETCTAEGQCAVGTIPCQPGATCDEDVDRCVCNSDVDCVGELACMATGTCDLATGECELIIDPGFCVIAEACFPDGAGNPDIACQFCDSSVSNSAWSLRDAGTACGDQADLVCDHPNTCNENGVCLANLEPAGTACLDDGNECTEDQCDGVGVCLHVSLTDGTACTHDGLFCTGVESCQSGICTSSGDPCIALGMVCDAAAEERDVCTCENDGACDDGLFCSGIETCGADGTCLPGTNPCDDGNECTDDECDEAGACLHPSFADGTACTQDGVFCTGVETCQSGICTSGGDPCIAVSMVCDAAAEETHVCSCDNDAACDDGLFCNGVESCGADGTCQPGTDPCDDGDPCTGMELCYLDGGCETTVVHDCNGNGLEDECDLAQGASDDLDGNGRPDECDAADGILIYQNTLGTGLFSPDHRGERVADDLTTLLGAPCAISKLRFRVNGGVEGGGDRFIADFSLYDGCPANGLGGFEIPGTFRRFDGLADNAAITHELVVDFSDRGICADGQECQVSLQNCGDASLCESNPLEIPPTVWLRIRFNTDEAGIIYGAPAQVGFSEDVIDRLIEPCTGNFGGWPEFPHASFWVEVFARSNCICNTDSDCDDGIFCNGPETCGESTACEPGTPPCAPGEVCDEAGTRCLCDGHDDCDDGLFCNGAETCGPDGSCVPAPFGCQPGAVCDEVSKICLCDSDDDCDDAQFCNGVESCISFGLCRATFVSDCNRNRNEDSCDVVQGSSSDCDGNLFPDECQTDCDEDGIPDACEVPPFGTKEDCDGNAVPDECQTDCDGNGIPDACEVPPYGDLQDCDGNLVPDECEVRDRLVGADRTLALSFDVTTGAATPWSGPGLSGPNHVEGMAFDPNSNRLYAVSSSNDHLITIDVDTGIYTDVGPIGFVNIHGMAFDSNANKLYGADLYSQVIRIDIITGAGTVVGGLPISDIRGLAFNPHTNELYATSYADRRKLFIFDVSTGANTSVEGEPHPRIDGLAFDPITSTLYGLEHQTDRYSNRLVRIDTTTGDSTDIGLLGFPNVTGLAFDPNTGTLYGANNNNSQHVYTISTVTGAATVVGALGFRSIVGMAYDRNTSTLYGLSGGGLLTIDLKTGAGTFLGFIVEPRFLGALAFDPNTNTLYASIYTLLYSIDVETAATTFIGSFPLYSDSRLSGLAFDADTDTLYGSTGRRLYTLNVETIGATLVGLHGSGDIQGLAFDPHTKVLYGADGDRERLMRIDTETGVGTVVGDIGFSNIKALAFVSGGGLDCNRNLLPDACDLDGNDRNFNGRPDDCDVAACLSGDATCADCNSSGIPDPFELMNNDCNSNDIPDDCEPVLDFDGDGFLDECDACLDSEFAEFILIEECPTGVLNALLDDGCTMNDVLSECAVGAHSHGELTACVVRHANEWRRQGLLSGKDVGRIARCAGASNEPRPSKRTKDSRSRGRR